MKFSLVFALAILSFNSMAEEHVISSSIKTIAVSQGCYSHTGARSQNFGLVTMCFDYDQKTVKTVQTYIRNDLESRGASVPEGRPYTTSSVSKKSVCNSGSSAGSYVEEACEATRRDFAQHIRN